MAIGIVQVASYSGNNANVTSQQATFANPTTAGNAIACWISWSLANNPGGIASVADPDNGSYTALAPSLVDSSAGPQTLEGFIVGDIDANAALTVTTTMTAANRYGSILIVEVGEVEPSPIAGPAAYNGSTQSPGPSTTDGLTSGDIIVPGGVSDALLIGASLDNFQSAPASGTGFTDQGAFWNFNNSSSAGGFVRLESLLVTPGTYATLFSGAVGNGSMTFGMALAQFGSGPSVVASPLFFGGAGVYS